MNDHHYEHRSIGRAPAGRTCLVRAVLIVGALIFIALIYVLATAPAVP